jgi:hypothetical protein
VEEDAVFPVAMADCTNGDNPDFRSPKEQHATFTKYIARDAFRFSRGAKNTPRRDTDEDFQQWP